LESLSKEITKDLGMPELVLDPLVSITTLLQRFPDLKSDFERPLPGAMIDDGSEGGVALTSAAAETPEPGTETPAAAPNDRLRRTLVLSKLLLNAFGPATQTKTVTAQQYAQWTQDLGRLEEAFGISARRPARSRWRWWRSRNRDRVGDGDSCPKRICGAAFKDWKESWYGGWSCGKSSRTRGWLPSSLPRLRSSSSCWQTKRTCPGLRWKMPKS
jgi:hypothetical protein